MRLKIKNKGSRRSDYLPPKTPVDRDGINAFIHLVRAAEDPEERIVRGRGGNSVGWKEVSKTPVAEWKQKILALLSDGVPRTFNRIVVELCGRTADVCFDRGPDWALWELVEEGQLIHTQRAPIYFRVA